MKEVGPALCVLFFCFLVTCIMIYLFEFNRLYYNMHTKCVEASQNMKEYNKCMEE